MAILKAAKVNIIEENIKMIENTIYNLQIQAKVNKSIGDDDGMKTTKEQLVKMEKRINEYTKILQEVKKEK